MIELIALTISIIAMLFTLKSIKHANKMEAKYDMMKIKLDLMIKDLNNELLSANPPMNDQRFGYVDLQSARIATLEKLKEEI